MVVPHEHAEVVVAHACTLVTGRTGKFALFRLPGGRPA